MIYLYLSSLIIINCILLVCQIGIARSTILARQEVPKWHISLVLLILFPEVGFDMDGIKIGPALASSRDRYQANLF